MVTTGIIISHYCGVLRDKMVNDKVISFLHAMLSTPHPAPPLVSQNLPRLCVSRDSALITHICKTSHTQGITSHMPRIIAALSISPVELELQLQCTHCVNDS